MEKHRKIFIDNYGGIPKGFHVHHINHNHDDNRPENLVAIPNKLHGLYHYSYSQILFFKEHNLHNGDFRGNDFILSGLFQEYNKYNESVSEIQNYMYRQARYAESHDNYELFEKIMRTI